MNLLKNQSGVSKAKKVKCLTTTWTTTTSTWTYANPWLAAARRKKVDVCTFVHVDDVDNIHNVMLMYHPKLGRQGKGWFNVNRLAAAFGWQIIDGVCVVFYAPAEVQHHQVHTIFQFLDWQRNPSIPTWSFVMLHLIPFNRGLHFEVYLWKYFNSCQFQTILSIFKRK